jgi:hypothetical protein
VSNQAARDHLFLLEVQTQRRVAAMQKNSLTTDDLLELS